MIAASIAGQSSQAVAGGAGVVGHVAEPSVGHTTGPVHGDRPHARSAVPLAVRPSGPWDRGPYDDVPDDVPDWLVDARTDGGRTRRRLMIGLVAFVVLSVLAVGAGAFVASEPRSEVLRNTTSTLPEPQPGSGIIDDAEDTAQRDGAEVDAAIAGAQGDPADADASIDTNATGGGTGDGGTTTAGADAGDGGTATSGRRRRHDGADEAAEGPCTGGWWRRAAGSACRHRRLRRRE